jgi:hypothetical protein
LTDSGILPGQNVGVLLLDETDAGFYVVGAKGGKATFIPRIEVGLVYYSDDSSGSLLSKQK